jgi:hypothetical protein
MGRASRYWLLVKVDSFGNCLSEEVEEAKTFFFEQFPALADIEDVPDREIQRRLVRYFQEDDTYRQIAECCLRCFISNQIKEVCLELEQKFGKQHDFTSTELLPLVLDSTLRSPCQETDEPQTTYRSVISRILQTFDPNKSNLSTWTARLLKSDRILKQFLLEHGLEQVTDWMILCYMNSGRLKRVLSDFDRTPTEINQALELLARFHQIYRTQLLLKRQAGDRRRYPEPTAQQLRQIAQQLSTTRIISPEQVLEQLQQLAQLLRSDRLRARKVPLRSEPLPKSQIRMGRNTTDSKDNTDEQSEFLASYHQQLDACLAQSVQQVIQTRFTYLQGKKNQKALKKAQNFLKALYLFHCQGIPMKEIAPQLGMNDQPQVSRLLELKALRSDIGRRTLLCLRNRVLELAQCYVSPKALRDLESRVHAVLDEEISTVILEAKKEASTGQNRVMNSKLSHIICQYLDTQEESNDELYY